jgi:GTP-binding protein
MFKVTASEYITSIAALKQLPRTGLPEIAFAGRSNVGKSSLINSLLGRKRLAQTSSTPGKTRLLNFFLINRRFYFVDLPGYGYARVSKELRKRWHTLVEPYLQRRETLRGVIQLMDSRHEPSEQDRELVAWLDHHHIPLLVVMTKADKLSRSRAQTALRDATEILSRDPGQCLLFSAKTNDGKGHIWQWIQGQIGL